jgi:hypothetical protein
MSSLQNSRATESDKSIDPHPNYQKKDLRLESLTSAPDNTCALITAIDALRNCNLTTKIQPSLQFFKDYPDLIKALLGQHFDYRNLIHQLQI